MRFIAKLLKMALPTVMGGAAIAKFLLKSSGDTMSEEIDLVSIYQGTELRSAADPFYGGNITTVFGGTLLDLRGATPAPTGIELDLVIAFGGLSIVVPDGWRASFTGQNFGGGFQDATRTTADPDTPELRLKGFLLASGLQVTTEHPAKAKTS